MDPNTVQPCPNHHTHTYNFDEFELGKGDSNQQPYFRAMFFFHKKPEHTDEFFHDHWKSVHADLTLSVKDTGVHLTRYVQFHQDARSKELVTPLVKSGMNLVSYDGCAEFHAKDAASFMKFMDNLHNSTELVGCGKRFVDLDKGYDLMVGYDNLILGNHIGSSGGSDGVSVEDKRLNTQELKN